ncbi:MAG: hypothetical protein DHS20C15_22970 [Planctomycetota bacterium]|nr:MAG: hypothetical protein DHS20C15_22970 [Planctomycetota bacterium]
MTAAVATPNTSEPAADTEQGERPEVSVLIVNYRSGAMTRGLIEHLRTQRLAGREPGEGLEFIVLDNASGGNEEAHLTALEADGVSVIRAGQNSGYAVGVNLAAERARGRFVLVSNPDVMIFRGALRNMVEYLQANPECGQVGPKSFLDAGRFFWLPPCDLPSLCELKSETFARLFKFWGKRHAAARTRRALKHWTMTSPTPATQLSGHCFMMPAPLARELGPFDTAYPLYYEDADLCLRLHRKGFSTMVLPNVSAVHFFNRSAGPVVGAAMSRYAVSRKLFYRRRYGLLGSWLASLLTSLGNSGLGKGYQFARVEDLGEVDEVPEIEVPGTGAYVAEISGDPSFVFAAGRLDVARRFQVPNDVWKGLAEGGYYLRFLERKTLRVLRTVKLHKVGHSAPVSAARAARTMVHA